MTNPLPIEFPGGNWPTFSPGWVWLVGAGPGDPGLLTLNALCALQQADVVVHDALIDPRILLWARPGARLIAAGKRGGRPSPKQAEITAALIELARAGQRVLRLKGGDPFVFGRGGEEAQELLRAGVPVRVMPGISSGIGGLALAGIPLTHGAVNRTVMLLTGHDRAGKASDDLDWPAIARAAEVIVVYMGLRTLADIARRLISGGRPEDEPVAIVSNAATAEQSVLETTLADAAKDAEQAGVNAPAIVCIGATVPLHRQFDWQAIARGEMPATAAAGATGADAATPPDDATRPASPSGPWPENRPENGDGK